jgi:NAD(P)-dependent dehydrogenase (short-subunit alcohol dehydrogenase family)
MGRLHPDFTDETVVVTGAASGIGRAVALGFGDAGATVLVADVRETPKDPGETVPTHERIVDAGGRAEYVETDVADLDEVATLVGSAREFGGVDVMVNNAGIHVNTPFREIEPGEFDRILAVNAVAPGATATEITEGWSRRAREMEGGFPGRAADPGELAGAYLYLASEDASYVNGEMLFVDGGSHVT